MKKVKIRCILLKKLNLYYDHLITLLYKKPNTNSDLDVIYAC